MAMLSSFLRLVCLAHESLMCPTMAVMCEWKYDIKFLISILVDLDFFTEPYTTTSLLSTLKLWLKDGDFKFQDIRCTDSNVSELIVSDDLFSTILTSEEAEEMVKEVSDKEIKEAMFDIEDNRALGPDGFSSVFFKKACNVVGRDVYATIKEFFSNRQMLGELNATLITLVPKIQSPHKVSEFRPIAYYNVLLVGAFGDCLNGCGFHCKMVGWIMQCVTTAGFTICLNKMLTLLLQRKIRNNDDFIPFMDAGIEIGFNLCFADDL
ncbi:hypothetical protein Tco_1176450 [Tanacetum coccineum]